MQNGDIGACAFYSLMNAKYNRMLYHTWIQVVVRYISLAMWEMWQNKSKILTVVVLQVPNVECNENVEQDIFD